MDNCVGILMTGAQAGVWYLETLQQKARLSRGRSTYVLPVKTLTVPFEDINLFLPDNMHMAASRILPYFREMNVMGVSRYILANITLHEAFDLVSDQIHGNGLLHLREIIREVFDHKINIMLVGSMYTMKGTYLSGLFTRSPVTIVEADEATQRELDHLRKLFIRARITKKLHWSLPGFWQDILKSIDLCWLAPSMLWL
ncbi:MAG: hypothetical protein HC819_17605 [Cyclobacteriaceae bacterium]|nr:hypothetical protein [Cyclobacteriaceae bacterium]